MMMRPFVVVVIVLFFLDCDHWSIVLRFLCDHHPMTNDEKRMKKKDEKMKKKECHGYGW